MVYNAGGAVTKQSVVVVGKARQRGGVAGTE